MTQVLAAVVRHVDWAVVRCLVIAGPGFAKDAFRAHLDAEAVRRELRCALYSGVSSSRLAVERVDLPCWTWGLCAASRGAHSARAYLPRDMLLREWTCPVELGGCAPRAAVRTLLGRIFLATCC